MKIGIIGCGYVFDHYMKTLHSHPVLQLAGITDIDRSRAEAVAHHYKLKIYNSNEDILSDPEIKLIVNLTNPDSHYEINKACLLAGKHVYSEKPFTKNLSQARELIDLADKKGLILSGAPCNLLSDTMQTIWKAVIDKTIGDPKLVYAEFDDNPIYLMKPEDWTSASGAPWPYRHEYEEGCTIEHAGYHLTWMVAMFGPARSIKAFSSCLISEKTHLHLDPSDTPDFSVACIVFDSGVVARLTNSIIAPLNHEIRIIGDKGMISANTYRHYHCPVYIERFSQLGLNARKLRSVRTSTFLQKRFGVGGKKQRLIRNKKTKIKNTVFSRPWNLNQMVTCLKNRELGIQDKLSGVVEMVESIEQKRKCLIPPDFLVHITELTMAISNAGTNGGTYTLKTSCAPLMPRKNTLEQQSNYSAARRKTFLGSMVDKFLINQHKHKKTN